MRLSERIVVLACVAFSLGAAAVPPKTTLPTTGVNHPGPLGLEWGKSPADARSILAGKLTFVSESPASVGGYFTIDQHYSGGFGQMAADDVWLRFFRGRFFYLAVRLVTSAELPAAKVHAEVIARMSKAYGPPQRQILPPALGSNLAIPDHLPLTVNRQEVMPLLWNERTRSDALGIFRLQDLMIRTGLWDPFAAWRFRNGIIVQTYTTPVARTGASDTPVLTPVWIFVDDQTFKAWRSLVNDPKMLAPRDF